MYEIILYETQNNKIPVEEFIMSLPNKLQAKALRDIEILSEFGPSLREPYSKFIENGVFELRTKFSSNIVRTFYFFFSGNKIILTNGFIKKTQKTPKIQIEKALKYKADFERREKNEI